MSLTLQLLERWLPPALGALAWQYLAGANQWCWRQLGVGEAYRVATLCNLTTACARGHRAIVAALVGRGCYSAADLERGLRTAIRMGHERVVRLLLGRGAGELARALASACMHREPRIVKLLTRTMAERGDDLALCENCGRAARDHRHPDGSAALREAQHPWHS